MYIYIYIQTHIHTYIYTYTYTYIHIHIYTSNLVCRNSHFLMIYSVTKPTPFRNRYESSWISQSATVCSCFLCSSIRNSLLSNQIKNPIKSSHRRCSVRKVVLRNFAGRFTGT